MKKIIVIDGGPRKTMNTAKMIEAFVKGVKASGEEIEVKHIRLYDISYHGCVACMACKAKQSKNPSLCTYKDGLTEVLADCQSADGLVFASPVYFLRVSAQMLGFIERLLFPWLSYNTHTFNAPRCIPTVTIYTMNIDSAGHQLVEPGLDGFDSLIGRVLQQPERVEALNTLQVKNYEKYQMDGFDLKGKLQWNQEHWDVDLRNAYEAGLRLVEKINGCSE